MEVFELISYLLYLLPFIGFIGSGSGTSTSDPYLITNMDELNDVRNELDAFYRLENDLDAGAETDNSGGTYWNGGSGWSPIAGAFFTGDFNGNGFAIDGLFISRSGTSEVGLFARQNGTVYDLQLTNVDITGGSETGGLAGYARSTGTTDRCEVEGTVVGGANSGLFMGRAGDSHVIKNSNSNGSITVDGAGNLAGGFVGNNTVTIEKCYAVCTINGTSDSKNGFTHFGTVNDCFYDSTVFTGGSARGTGKTTSEMQDVATFTDTATSGLTNPWDFVGNPNDDTANNDYWDIDTGYPFLTAFAPAGGVTLTAEQGSYTLTGQTANLLRSLILGADQGSYTLSGQAVTFLQDYVIVAEQGTYTTSTSSASLLQDEVLQASQGSYTFTGQDAALTKGFILTAEQGTYTVTGQDATLLFNRVLAAQQGTYTLTGQDTNLLRNLLLEGGAGNYVLSGQNVTLTVVSSTSTEKLRLDSIISDTLSKESTITDTLSLESIIDD